MRSLKNQTPEKVEKYMKGGPKRLNFKTTITSSLFLVLSIEKSDELFRKKTWSKVDYKSDGINRNWNRLRSIAKVPADAHLFNPNKVAEVKFPRWL